MYERFSELLKKKGITPYRVYVETGVSQSTLSDWKRGRCVPKYENLLKIANYFGVTVEYLMGETDEKNKPLVNGDEELTRYLEELKNRKEMRMLFSVSEGCTKEEVEQAVRIIEALRKKDDDEGC